jgi:hypothetical protein
MNSRRSIPDFVSVYYKKATLRSTYGGELLPVPDKSTWFEDAVEIGSGDESHLLPPKTRRPAGRPKKKRIRHGSENKQVREFRCLLGCTGLRQRRASNGGGVGGVARGIFVILKLRGAYL